jgi:hypothetical protein
VTAGTATNLLASPAISIAAGQLVVALISADGTTARPTTVTAVTNTAPKGTTALTWTRAVGANAQAGDAEIYWAIAGTPQPATSVRAKLNRPNTGSLTVMTFSGATATLVGNIGSLSGTTSPARATLTTGNTSSLVVGVGSMQGAAGVMTTAPAPIAQTIINQFSPTGGDTYWSQRTTATVPASGTSVTISATPSGTVGAWNMAILEIRRQ